MLCAMMMNVSTYCFLMQDRFNYLLLNGYFNGVFLKSCIYVTLSYKPLILHVYALALSSGYLQVVK